MLEEQVDESRVDVDDIPDVSEVDRLKASDARSMIESGQATGGMIPKLENLISLLDRGVSSAHVIGGTNRNGLLAEVFTDEGTGTMLVRG